MFRRGIFAAACLAIFDTSAIACLWTHDAPVGEEYEKTESTRRVGVIESAIRGRASDRKDLLRAHEYNPANPVAQKNDLAVQALLRGEAKKAVEMLLDIESETPGKYFTAANLGTFHAHAGDYTRGLEELRRAIAINPDAHFGREKYQVKAIEYLQQNRDRPFFLACGFTKPHSPPTAPKKFFDLYDAKRIPLPVDFAATPAAPAGFPKPSITPNGDLFIGREATPDEAHWRERPALARTESPRYLGRAVAALAADPQVLARSGDVLRVADLAREYGFTDIDGRQVEAFEL